MQSNSSSPRRMRTLGAGVLAALLLGAALPGASPADGNSGRILKAAALPVQPTPLNWSLQSRPCQSEPEGYALKVPCGSYGIFYFFDGAAPAGDCQRAGQDDEDPPIYNAPGSIIFTGERFLMTIAAQLPKAALPGVGGSGGPDPPGRPDPTAEEVIPCAEGSCLASQPGGENGLETWGASIDWADWHGFTTAAAQKQISGLSTYLFPLLEEGAVVETLGDVVGDGHVLVQMCRAAESSYQTPTSPPEVLSMSFGRPALSQSELTDTGARCVQDSIPCQLKRVIDHLHDVLGIEMMAAAGNHTKMHFPAFYEKVTSVGSLDMAWFNTHGGAVKKSWESPSDADAYLPGYGVCLYNDNPDRLDTLWPAPAGSSYATAIFAGWRAAIAEDGVQPNFTPPDGVWAPFWTQVGKCYVLSEDPATSCNTEANLILQRILGMLSETCWSGVELEPNLDVQATLPGVSESVAIGDSIGLDEWVSSHRPAPEPDFCIPCSGGGGYKSSGKALTLGAGVGGTSGGGGSIGSSIGVSSIVDRGLVIDLSGYTSSFEGYEIENIYFRVGTTFFPILDRSRPGDAEKLDQIGDGEFKSLTIFGLAGKIPASSQPSLFYTTCEDSGCYWSSVPILMI